MKLLAYVKFFFFFFTCRVDEQNFRVRINENLKKIKKNAKKIIYLTIKQFFFNMHPARHVTMKQDSWEPN